MKKTAIASGRTDLSSFAIVQAKVIACSEIKSRRTIRILVQIDCQHFLSVAMTHKWYIT